MLAKVLQAKHNTKKICFFLLLLSLSLSLPMANGAK